MSTAQTPSLGEYLERHSDTISPVVDFEKGIDKLYHFNFTSSNTELSPAILANTDVFTEWISGKLSSENCRYGIGGYKEHRTIYSRSHLFDTTEEPRRFHLGTDVWGPVGTEVFSPLEGKIHSFNFNGAFGDYGATIILEHEAGGFRFHSLYGHLSLRSIAELKVGVTVSSGQKIAEFGDAAENGHWPPHLHFQLILDMRGWQGDYPGVCKYSEADTYLANSPNPALILKHTFGY